jgi:type IV secretory pathway VirB10-like protein
MSASLPERSPDLLAPVAAKTGVGRLNRVPVLIGVGIGLAFAGMLIYNYWERMPSRGLASTAPADTSKAGAAQGPPPFMKGTPTSGIIPGHTGAAAGPENTHTLATSANMPAPTSGHVTPGTPEAGSGRAPGDQLWQDYQRHTAQVQDEHFDAERQALEAASSITLNQQVASPVPSETTTSVSAYGSDGGAMREAAAGLRNIAALAGGGQSRSFDSANGQSAKQGWLDTQPNTDDYLHHGRTAPVSPYEVKAGTVIPALMIGGVNSDTPGQLIAQVSENVYDTASGRFLLIPQGSKLVGTYDNQVTFGQSRVLVGWQRIIYPDASALDLGRMSGADISGYAGFKDKVNNHLFKVFSEAFMLSIFSAGIQLGQPQATNGQNYNSTQIVSAAIAQQMGELGMEIVRRNMDVAPTLEIRPGYAFNVMVSKDMVIAPWVVR